MTRWVVMRKCDDGRWEERARVDNGGRHDAVESTADVAGTYVAIEATQLLELPVEVIAVARIARNGAEPDE